MSKRFTETGKWQDPWFRRLSPGAKCLFMYLCDQCDCAGFIELDAESAAFHIGASTEQISAALKALSKAVVVKGDWVWLPNFLRHQKNLPLNQENRAHRPIILSAQSHWPLFQADLSRVLDAPSKGLVSPTGKGKGKGKGKGSGEEGSEEGNTAEHFAAFWEAYPVKKDKKKAEKAWKSRKLDKRADEIIADVSNKVANDKSWREGFAPHPTTYINGDRWEDEIATPVVDKSQPTEAGPLTDLPPLHVRHANAIANDESRHYQSGISVADYARADINAAKKMMLPTEHIARLEDELAEWEAAQ